MRTVIFQVIEGRPKEDTMSEWMMKSLKDLSKYRPKSSKRIEPISLPDSGNKLYGIVDWLETAFFDIRVEFFFGY